MNTQAETDLQLILDAAAQTPCVGPQDPANVAAWVLGAARRMEELQAELGLAAALLKHREVEQDRNRLRSLVRTLFEQYLDVVEESDSGRAFHPVRLSCCRAQWTEPMERLLQDLRAAAGCPPVAATPVETARQNEEQYGSKDLRPKCGRCGAPMRFNVPRMGPLGGFVHVESGRLECADTEPTPPSS